MKESERIKIEMDNDDSDNEYRTCAYFKKIERAKKKESFQENILPKIKEKFEVTTPNDTEYIINLGVESVTFYPKSGSLLFHNSNQWIKGRGLQWIKKQLI